MKVLLFFLIACGCVVKSAGASGLDGWATNLMSALRAAKPIDQPVLAYFTASWCGPCKLMAATTFTNQAVREALARLPHVALDLDQETALAERYEVQAVPSFLLLTPSGHPIARTTGFQDAATFLGWLTNGLNEAQATIARQNEVKRKLAEMDPWLKGTDVALLKQAATNLIEFCAERDDGTRQLAVERLTALAARQPALLLPGLTHARLSARIQVSNLLRKQLGEKFDIDPWSDLAARTQGVAQWSQLLSSPATP